MKKQIAAGALALVVVSGVALAGPGGRFHGGGMFDAMDANDDGAVTMEEINQRQAERFARFDANGDGKVNVDELDAGIRRERSERLFSRLDRNGDGNVTQDELDGIIGEMFARIDTNDDGKVTKDEIPSRLRAGHERGERVPPGAR